MTIGTEIAKVVEAAETPITRLVEAVCGAVGKLYEPWHHRRMTDANVYRASEYSKAIKEHSDVPIVFKDDQLAIDTSDYEALCSRAGQRLAYQEITKQENIEAIVDKAFIALENRKLRESRESLGSLEGLEGLEGQQGKASPSKEPQSDEKISPEWMNRFINTAGEISTEEMQELWAKVLAGEAVKPNSFSLRTLDCLRNLSSSDAKLFEKISEFVIEDNCLYNDKELNSKYGIHFADILRLDDCGLINSNAFISRNRDTNTNPELFIDFGEYALLVASKDKLRVSAGQYPLTNTGKELLNVVRKKLISFDYVRGVCSSVKRRNTNAVLTIHKVNARLGGAIECDAQNIKVEL